MDKKNKALLVTIVTPDHIIYAQQLFASAHKTGRWQGQYMILCPGISTEDRNWFESRGILVRDYPYICSEEQRLEFERVCKKRIHRIVFERLHLFREEFKQWDTIVYTDTDVIVNAPLVRLSHLKGFWATPDDLFNPLAHQFSEDGIQYIKQKGFRIDARSFCAGFYAFGTELITVDTFKTMLDLFQSITPISRFQDQTILNYFFYEKWKCFSVAYGFMLDSIPGGIYSSPANTISIHFCGISKRPWDPASPYYSLWKNNSELSQTIDFRSPEPITFKDYLNAFVKERSFPLVELRAWVRGMKLSLKLRRSQH